MAETILAVIVIIGLIFLVVLILELRDLRQEKDLRIEEYRKPSPDTKRAEHGEEHVSIAIVLQALSREYKAGNTKQERYNLSQRRVGIGTLVIVVIYTSINYFGLVATKESYTAVQRAFINISELRQEPNRDRDGNIISWRFTPQIINSGNTPAIDVSIAAANPYDDFDVVPKTIPIESYKYVSVAVGAPQDPDRLFGLHDPSPKFFNLIHFTIGPKGSITASELAVDMAPKDALAAQTGTIGRFFYGIVYYDDVFKVAHISKYCFRIDTITIENAGGHNPIAHPMQSLCGNWNCTDETCYPDQASYYKKSAYAFQRWAAQRPTTKPNMPK